MAFLVIPFIFVFSWGYLLTYSTNLGSSYLYGYPTQNFLLFELGGQSYGFDFTFLRTMSANFYDGTFYFVTALSLLGGLILFVLPFIALLMPRQNRIKAAQGHLFDSFYIAFILMLLLSIIFTVRQFPLILASMLLSKYILNRGLYWAFIRNPVNYAGILIYSWSMAMAFSLAILFSYFGSFNKNCVHSRVSLEVTTKHGSTRKFEAPIIAVAFALFAVVLVLSSSMLLAGLPNSSGDYGVLRTITVPAPYYKVGSFLENNSANLTKSWWLPPTYYTHPIFSWAPNPYGRPSAWIEDVSPTPSMLPGGSELSSVSYQQFLYYQQLDGMIKNDTNVLAPYGVKYIIVHADQYSTGNFIYDSASRLNQTLTNQPGVTKSFSDSFITAYRTGYNSGLFFMANPTLIVGGPLNFILLSDAGLNSTEFSPLFLSQLNSKGMSVAMNATKIVFLGPHQTIQTFFLDTLLNFMTNPGSSGVFSQSWFPAYGLNRIVQIGYTRHNMYVPWSGEPPIGNAEMVSQQPGNFTFDLRTNTGGNDSIWIKALTSPLSGNISVSVGGIINKKIDLYNSNASYMKWIYLGSTSLVANKSAFTMDDINGINAINSVLSIPTSHYQGLYNNFANSLKDKTLYSINFSMISSFSNVVIQQFPGNHPSNQYASSISNNTSAQTFLAPVSNISGFEVILGAVNKFANASGNILIELVNTTVSGIPGSKVIRTWLINGSSLNPAATTVFLDSNGLKLTAGDEYALTFRAIAEIGYPNSFTYVARAFPIDSNRTYGNGSMWYYNGTSWNKANWNIWFKVFSPKRIFTNNTLMAGSINVVVKKTSFSGAAINQSANLICTLNSEYRILSKLTFNEIRGVYSIKIVNLNSSVMLVMTQNYYAGWLMDGQSPIPTYFTENGYLIKPHTATENVIVQYYPSASYNYSNWMLFPYFGLMSSMSILEIYLKSVKHNFRRISMLLNMLRKR